MDFLHIMFFLKRNYFLMKHSLLILTLLIICSRLISKSLGRIYTEHGHNHNRQKLFESKFGYCGLNIEKKILLNELKIQIINSCNS